MPKYYVSKPKIVEAEQFFYDASSWPEGVYQTSEGIFLETEWGPAPIGDGEWVITIGENRYRSPDDEFQDDYEEIPEDDESENGQ